MGGAAALARRANTLLITSLFLLRSGEHQVVWKEEPLHRRPGVDAAGEVETSG